MAPAGRRDGLLASFLSWRTFLIGLVPSFFVRCPLFFFFFELGKTLQGVLEKRLFYFSGDRIGSPSGSSPDRRSASLGMPDDATIWCLDVGWWPSSLFYQSVGLNNYEPLSSRLTSFPSPFFEAFLTPGPPGVRSFFFFFRRDRTVPPNFCNRFSPPLNRSWSGLLNCIIVPLRPFPGLFERYPGCLFLPFFIRRAVLDSVPHRILFPEGPPRAE